MRTWSALCMMGKLHFVVLFAFQYISCANYVGEALMIANISHEFVSVSSSTVQACRQKPMLYIASFYVKISQSLVANSSASFA